MIEIWGAKIDTKSHVMKGINLRQSDDNLYISHKLGIAYQIDKNKRIEYNDDYFDEYVRRSKTKIGQNINKVRIDLVNEMLGDKKVIDIGCGACTFINSRENTYGYDVMNSSIKILNDKNLYLNPFKKGLKGIDGVTFWDSLEHFDCPTEVLGLIRPGMYVFISIPIIENLFRLKTWKHYKPDEHYWYFTNEGFLEWMKNKDFHIIYSSNMEIGCGREDIKTYVFMKE